MKMSCDELACKKMAHNKKNAFLSLSMDLGEHLGNRETAMTNKPSGVNN